MKPADFLQKDRYDIVDAVEIVRCLRNPVGGCPWDCEQTHESIRKNFLEEAYEACDAIDKQDKHLLQEELGDVFLQVALHCEIERQSGGFDINDVMDELCRKLIRRHPHVFGEVKATTGEQVLANWDRIKRDEKSQTTASKSIDDVPAALPALAKSQKVGKRAADFGFDYPDAEGALSDLRSELEEAVAAANGNGDLEEEIGDLLFACVNYSRLLGIDAEQATEHACAKFVSRFKKVEAAARADNIDMKTCGINKLNELWNAAKTV